MAQRIFGNGLAWATPLVDAYGNSISNPTPVIFGTLQDVSLDISYETKELYGSDSQFALAVARGKAKVSGKAKFADIKGSIFSSVVFGQSLSSGFSSIKQDTVGSLIPVGLTVTPTIPNSGTYLNDLGVVNATNYLPFTRVASAPAVGQYSVDTSTGVYTFNTADQTKTVYITFSYTSTTVTNAQKGTISSQMMGMTPTFSLDLHLPNVAEGQAAYLHLYKCTTSKFSIATKTDDFSSFDLDFTAFANSAKKVMEWSTQE